MIKFLINITELTIIAVALVKILRFAFSKRKNKSIVGKLALLINRSIHHRLDRAIKNQSQAYGTGKVVSFKTYKRRVN